MKKENAQLSNEQSRERKRERPCPFTGCGGIMEEYVPSGWGQEPRLICNNPNCPGKKKKEESWI